METYKVIDKLARLCLMCKGQLGIISVDCSGNTLDIEYEHGFLAIRIYGRITAWATKKTEMDIEDLEEKAEAINKIRTLKSEGDHIIWRIIKGA